MISVFRSLLIKSSQHAALSGVFPSPDVPASARTMQNVIHIARFVGLEDFVGIMLPLAVDDVLFVFRQQKKQQSVRLSLARKESRQDLTL